MNVAPCPDEREEWEEWVKLECERRCLEWPMDELRCPGDKEEGMPRLGR